MRRVRTNETVIVNSCLAWLETKIPMVWRNNKGAMQGAHKGKCWFMRFGGLPGASDIFGVMPGGRFLAVEVKRPGQKPTEEQRAFLRQVNASGGVGLWVTSVEELERDFRELEGC